MCDAGCLAFGMIAGSILTLVAVGIVFVWVRIR